MLFFFTIWNGKLYKRHNLYDAGNPTSKGSDENACDAKTQADYKKLLGELIYLMVQTRPDLAYSISKLAQFMSNPREEQ